MPEVDFWEFLGQPDLRRVGDDEDLVGLLGRGVEGGEAQRPL